MRATVPFTVAPISISAISCSPSAGSGAVPGRGAKCAGAMHRASIGSGGDGGGPAAILDLSTISRLRPSMEIRAFGDVVPFLGLVGPWLRGDAARNNLPIGI